MRKSVQFAATALSVVMIDAAAFAAHARQAAAPDKVEDLIVTAQRREQNLQETPVAVSAFSAKALDQLQIAKVQNLAASVPSLYISQISASPSTVQISLRGALDQTGGMITSEPPVGIYINDVYQARLSVANMDLADVQRIEVLRGPQGTLYGRNSMTGALKYVTRQPDGTGGGTLDVSVGNHGQQRYRGTAGGAISDHVAAAVSGLFSTRDGWQYDTTLKSKVGKRQDSGVRAALGLTDVGPFSATVEASYARTDSEGQYFVPLDPTTLKPLAAGPFGSTRTPSKTDTRNEQKTLALHLGYAGEAVTFKSISAYQRLDDHWTLDFSGGLVNGAGATVAGFLRGSDTAQEQVSQEFQALGDAFGGRLQWIGGVFYFKETGTQVVTDTIGAGVYAAFPIALLPTTIHAKSESTAIYGQAEYRFTDRLKGSVGVRYTDDDKAIHGTIQNGLAAYPATLVAKSNSANWKVWTPKFNLQYDISDDVMAYATVARGYRAGGFVALSIANPTIFTQGYDPESAWSYEVGAKLEGFEHRARLNVAAYLEQLKDLQQNVLQNGSTLTQNAAEARIAGLEVEASVAPAKGVNLFASMAYTDAKYETLDPTTAAAQAGATHLPLISKLQAQVGGAWRIEPAALAGGAVIVAADYSHRSPRYSEATNAEAGHIGSVDRVNASVTYESQNGQWQAYLQGRNVLNSKDYYSGAVFIPGLIVYRGADDPLMWSVGVKFKY
jgi:iron complex outermembrane receptor protein